MTRIDVGGGHSPEPGYTNLDPVHGEGLWRTTVEVAVHNWTDPRALDTAISRPTPFGADMCGTVEAIRASHVLEHTRTVWRVAIMNAFHDLLGVGTGHELTIIVPVHPYWQCYADPTHISVWVPQSFDYFTGGLVAQADYGIQYWDRTFYEETYDGAIVEWRGTPR